MTLYFVIIDKRTGDVVGTKQYKGTPESAPVDYLLKETETTYTLQLPKREFYKLADINQLINPKFKAVTYTNENKAVAYLSENNTIRLKPIVWATINGCQRYTDKDFVSTLVGDIKEIYCADINSKEPILLQLSIRDICDDTVVDMSSTPPTISCLILKGMLIATPYDKFNVTLKSEHEIQLPALKTEGLCVIKLESKDLLVTPSILHVLYKDLS